MTREEDAARAPSRLPRASRKPIMPYVKTALAAAVAATVTGKLPYWFAAGTMGLFERCVTAAAGSMSVFGVQCTNPGSAPFALGCAGALLGGWFVLTGRLARLFRKV